MDFKDLNSNQIIAFKNFIFQNNEDPKLVTFEITINYSIFKSKTKLVFELLDLISFLSNLKVLHQTLKHSFYLKHNDNLLSINFICNKNNQILLKVILNSPDYSGTLEFEFETDQTIILELIKDLEIILGAAA